MAQRQQEGITSDSTCPYTATRGGMTTSVDDPSRPQHRHRQAPARCGSSRRGRAADQRGDLVAHQAEMARCSRHIAA